MSSYHCVDVSAVYCRMATENDVAPSKLGTLLLRRIVLKDSSKPPFSKLIFTPSTSSTSDSPPPGSRQFYWSCPLNSIVSVEARKNGPRLESSATLFLTVLKAPNSSNPEVSQRHFVGMSTDEAEQLQRLLEVEFALARSGGAESIARSAASYERSPEFLRVSPKAVTDVISNRVSASPEANRALQFRN